MNLHGYKRVATAQVVPSDENPRTHSETQLEQIRRSIQEFGFTNPILVDEDNCLIAGHGRLRAAISLGMGGKYRLSWCLASQRPRSPWSA